ncbi:MAG: cyclase family protein [Chloroflexi bacterium]|nr:MAG: cyclase family protein [Chloroflexota bacterium]
MSNDWMDISVPIYTGMAHWPDNPPVRVEHLLHIRRGDICTVSTLSMGSHTGTHMDGPFHFLLEGKGLHEMPLDAAIGRARVIEIHDPESIKLDELLPHNVQQGERLLFKTLNSIRCWKTDTFVEDLSVGGFAKDGLETHLALLGADIWIIEGLDLSQIEPGTYELICLPLKIADSDGAPARAILRKTGGE